MHKYLVYENSENPYFYRILGLEGHDGIPCVDCSDEGLLVLNSDDIGDRGDVELSGNTGQHRSVQKMIVQTKKCKMVSRCEFS